MISFLERSVSDRIRVIREDKDPIHVYEILGKHLRSSIPELQSMYSITLDFPKNRLFISGEESKIFELFIYLNDRGLDFESITTTDLRLELSKFLLKII